LKQRTSFHPPASVYVGAVTPEYEAAILQCTANRFSVSSESTIKTAVSHWEPFAVERGIPTFIPNGDPNRGGIAASFAIFLAKKKLAYGTIQGYIWGWEQHHMNRGHHSPLDNVQDWARWMRALEVQIYTPSEPTEMVPFQLLVRSLLCVYRAIFWMVRTACAMLMLFYTMSRSEYPVPKTHDGQNNFDPEQHCRQCDLRACNGYIEWAFGKIKQDRLGKRLKGGKREWKPVGNATGVMSMVFWVDLYLQMRPKNDDMESAFFVREDGTPLLYHDLLEDMRKLFLLVDGVTEQNVKRLGLHGLRVLGYNAGKAAMGEEVAALQGGWFSDCHTTYSRETLNSILAMAQQMATKAATAGVPKQPMDGDEPILPDLFSDTTQIITPPAVQQTQPPARPTLPEITSERRGTESKRYRVYFVEGRSYRSLKQAKLACSTHYFASLGYSLK